MALVVVTTLSGYVHHLALQATNKTLCGKWVDQVCVGKQRSTCSVCNKAALKNQNKGDV